jgi:leader peptidase (prepilin peptidase)/N-methyltransferase
MIFEIIPILCIAAALLLLLFLSIIDLKILILPDELNFSLGLAGIVFHLSAGMPYFGWGDMILGAVIGGGMLYVIRFFANKAYQKDTLGLGDVKLLAAAGLWLGPETILLAVTLGAFAGLLHGLTYAGWLAIKTKQKVSINNLTIPAGPGFAIGIILAGAYLLGPFVMETLHEIFA